MEPHSIVVVSLHTPKEKLWGELLEVSTAGVTIRGIDLSAFDDFVSHGAADIVFPHDAHRAHRPRRGSRVDSVAGRNV
jgi:hypothetical protein